MRTFRLGDAAFGRLAAGRPDADTLDELRRAQLSRHLLQLREIVRAGPPDWYDELTAAGPEAVRETVADPMTGLYAVAVRRGELPASARPGLPTWPARTGTSSTGHQAPRMLTATHDGLTLRVRLEDTDPLRARLGLTPTGPLSAAEADRWARRLAGAWRILVTRHRPDALRLAAVLRVIVPVEPDPAAGGISATSADAFGAVAVSMPADDVALAVGLLHETAHSLLNATHFLFGLVERSPKRGYSPWRDDPRPALGVLHGAYAYLAVTRFWRTEAAATKADDATTTTTASASTTNTASAANAASASTTNTVSTCSTSTASPSAATHDERTASGASSAGRVAGFEFARWRVAGFEFARWRVAVVEAAGGLLDGSELTAAGVRFVEALRDEVAGWLDEPVDAAVAALAAEANADHRARWRLRNLEVDPDAVRALVAAWRAGRPAPPLPPATLRADSGRVLPHSERLTRIHEMLRGPGSGGEDKIGPGSGDENKIGPGSGAESEGGPGLGVSVRPGGRPAAAYGLEGTPGWAFATVLSATRT